MDDVETHRAGLIVLRSELDVKMASRKRIVGYDLVRFI